jgi:hypothetical protein
MCAYKLCRVEFKYWGMQAKIERFIHDIALRKTMVRAHRQAWTWQDEWFNLTMDDIRELERQTQEALAKKMASATTTTSEGGLEQQQLQQEAKTSGGVIPSSLVPASPEIGGQETVDSKGQPVAAASVQGAPSWPMSCISESSSEDDEFFDCQDFRSGQAGGALSPTMVRWSSMELVPQGEEADELDPAEKVPDERIEVRVTHKLYFLPFLMISNFYLIPRNGTASFRLVTCSGSGLIKGGRPASWSALSCGPVEVAGLNLLAAPVDRIRRRCNRIRPAP